MIKPPPKGLSEKQVETRLMKRVKDIGGQCEKFTSPNRRSVPDRMCTYEPEMVHFVECKREGEDATPAQKRDHERRRAMGFAVFVIDNYEKIEGYIVWVQQMQDAKKRMIANQKEIQFMMRGQ